MYITHIYIYVYKSFSTTFDKGLRKNIKKENGEMEWRNWRTLTK